MKAKRGRTEVSGLLVEDATGARALVAAEELTACTQLSACKVEQCQRFQFPHTLPVLARALRETYDEVDVVEGVLLVCDCVRVSLVKQLLCVTWDSSPMADLVADSVSLSAIELTRNPTAAQALQIQEDASAGESRIFRVLCTYLRQEFGRLELDEEAE